MIGKLAAIDALQPLFPAMARWYCDAMDDFNRTLSDEQKARQGPRTRSLWVQREAVARMREDPAVVGDFRPIESNQLDCLFLAGDPVNICVLLNKVHKDRYGRMRTARNDTYRQFQRRGPTLDIQGIETAPVVLYWMPSMPLNQLHPEVGIVGIGEELESGFDWMHTFYKHGEGLSGVVLDGQPNLPMLPEPGVRLRRPAVPAAPSKVGTKADDQRRQAEARKEGGSRTKSSEGA